jgi:hypothetical protein
MLPDDVLLEIFDFFAEEFVFYKRKDRVVADTVARVSALVKRCFRITTSPPSATLLFRQNASKGHAGSLTTLASLDSVLRNRRTRALLYRTRAHRSCV